MTCSSGLLFKYTLISLCYLRFLLDIITCTHTVSYSSHTHAHTPSVTVHTHMHTHRQF